MTPEEKKAYDKAYREKNKERIASNRRALYARNGGKEQARAYYEANREKMNAISREEKSTPWGKFRTQKSQAKRRGIEWNFTFEQWIEWWGEDFDRRGRGPNDLVMARFGDTGPYSPENVRKATVAENHSEANLGRIPSEETRTKMSVAASSWRAARRAKSNAFSPGGKHPEKRLKIR